MRNKCGFTDGLFISSVGRSGGLGFWWKDVNVMLSTFLNHHFSVTIRDELDREVWRVVSIYGWPKISNKWQTWQLMRRLKDETNSPLLYFGDFNEILSQHEKQGGAIRG